ncbi:MAG: sugar transferase [Actinomycetota bacterium]
MTVQAIRPGGGPPVLGPGVRSQFSGHRVATWLLTVITALCGTVGTLAAAVYAPTLSIAMALGVTGIAVATLIALGQYRTQMTGDVSSAVAPVSKAVGVAGFVLIVAVAWLPVSDPSLDALAGMLMILAASLLVGFSIGHVVIRNLWLAGRLRAAALVVGVDGLARELAVEVTLHPEFGIDVVGFVTPGGLSSEELPAPVFDLRDDILEVFAANGADRLVVAADSGLPERVGVRAARRVAAAGIPVFVVPRFHEMGLGGGALAPDRVRGYPLVRLQRAAHPQISIRLKRAFDVTVASLMLALLSPVLAAIAVLVRLSGSGPVLFDQQRVGQFGRPIVIHKFRSMHMSETSDEEWTADGRITWVGRWLRRFNLDELPQLWSVIRGDMSLVGPRPERPVFVREFKRVVPDYDDRHRMPVGITGLAQVQGLRGDTSITERVKYDNLYIDQWSFATDLLILAKTVPAMVRQRRSAVQQNTLTEELGRQDAAVAPKGRQRVAN